MQAYQGMQQFKSANKEKTILLFILFPIFLFLITRAVVAIAGDHSIIGYSSRKEASFYQACGYFSLIAVILIIWGIISFTKQKDIMFKLSGAKALDRKDNPELYNIVENLCISKGIPMPQIAIMEEPGMNAFATGWKPKDSWICFTAGLVQNLDKNEIEAVAGHELTHIMNKDCLLMYVALIFIGCLTIAGEGIIRIFSYSSSSSSRGNIKRIFTLLGLGFLLLGYLFYPLIRLAISRKREYLADLGSVELTHDSESMISALKKISSNSYVSSANTKISEFFIASPKGITKSLLAEAKLDNYTEVKEERTSLRDSHPSISDRINRIRNYGSGTH